ncbi:hypothetical protein [Pelagibacterium montanilacus]|uniref:hypothetical protein n=1 Tax=Pelagibacterium montanilacus TaxID=2185280 RepID=UPI000F8D1646|nr:hypothetical protein [Pelagibacterium montanilacus]
MVRLLTLALLAFTTVFLAASLTLAAAPAPRAPDSLEICAPAPVQTIVSATTAPNFLPCPRAGRHAKGALPSCPQDRDLPTAAPAFAGEPAPAPRIAVPVPCLSLALQPGIDPPPPRPAA